MECIASSSLFFSCMNNRTGPAVILLSFAFTLGASGVHNHFYTLPCGNEAYALPSHLLSVEQQCEFMIALQRALSEVADNNHAAVTFATINNKQLLAKLRMSCDLTVPPMRLLTISFDAEMHSLLSRGKDGSESHSILLNIGLGTGELLRTNSSAMEKYRNLSLTKQLILSWGVAMGFHMLSLDTDVIMLQSFFHVPLPDGDIIGQGTRCSSLTACQKVSGGFIFYRANQLVQKILTFSADNIVRGELSHQAAIWTAIDEFPAIRVSPLPLTRVPYINEMYGCFGFNDVSSVIAIHFTMHAAYKGCGSSIAFYKSWYSMSRHGWLPWLPSRGGGLTVAGKLQEEHKLWQPTVEGPTVFQPIDPLAGSRA